MTNWIKKMVSKNNKGFTLMELMTVITVVGILATVVSVPYRDTVSTARVSATMMTMTTLFSALNEYKKHTKDYPSDIAALLYDDGAKKWDGPYLDIPIGGIITDGWGNEFTYLHGDDLDAINVNTYDLCSLGEDTDPLLGGDDDICNYII